VVDEGLHEFIADDLDAVDDLSDGGFGGIDGEGEVEVIKHGEHAGGDGGHALELGLLLALDRPALAVLKVRRKTEVLAVGFGELGFELLDAFAELSRRLDFVAHVHPGIVLVICHGFSDLSTAYTPDHPNSITR